MSVCFGEYLCTKLGECFKTTVGKKMSKADRLYKTGLSLKTGDGVDKNMRDAFKMFREASEYGHEGAIAEMKECYRNGRGCERDLTKVADLGDSKEALKQGKKMEREGRMRESIKYYWIASEGGESEATLKLADIYRNGEFVERDIEESERLNKVLVTQFQMYADGTEWRIRQQDKTMFIRGNANMNTHHLSNRPWESHKTEICAIVIEDGVKSIDNFVFVGLEELKSIFIPANVTSIGFNFQDCRKLENVSVSAENYHYSSEDGVLFNKDKSILICCPKAKQGVYEVPNGVVSIGDGAFSECTELTSVILPNTVEKIGIFAFEGCSNLESVRLPPEMTMMGSWAFGNCPKLNEIQIGIIGCIGREVFDRTCQLVFNSPVDDELHPIDVEEQQDTENIFSLYKRAMEVSARAFCDTELIKFAYEEDIDERERVPLFIVLSNAVLNQSNGLVWTKEENFEWGFDKGIGRLVIKGEGMIDDYVSRRKSYKINNYGVGDLGPPWTKKYGQHIKSVFVCYGASSIGSNAFSHCKNLYSVVIPEGLKCLGYDAFHGCKELKKVFIPSSVELINGNPCAGCEKLLSFEVCKGNHHFTLLDGVLFDEDKTQLIYCPLSKSAVYEIPGTVQKICSNAFRDCQHLSGIVIPDSVTFIGDDAFRKCSNLIQITIPNSVIFIGNRAFYDCGGLTVIDIPISLTSIGNSTFSRCRSLRFFKLSNSIMMIGNFAFSYCESLTTITIPDSVKTIDANPFAFCKNLSSIKIKSNPDFVSPIDNVLFNRDKTILICCPAAKTGSYSIPSSVVSIGMSAFGGCRLLTSINIRDGVRDIGIRAFENCEMLKQVKIPETVTSIGDEAFANCYNLSTVAVPAAMNFPRSAFPEQTEIMRF